MAKAKARCFWCGDDPLYVAYHDDEWGVPVHDDRLHFEQLILEGAQAGLSWLTVLRKREHYRQAFAQFDPRKVARFDARKIDALMQNAGLVRHRGKLESAVGNARAPSSRSKKNSAATMLGSGRRRRPFPPNATA